MIYYSLLSHHIEVPYFNMPSDCGKNKSYAKICGGGGGQGGIRKDVNYAEKTLDYAVISNEMVCFCCCLRKKILPNNQSLWNFYLMWGW